MIISNEYKKNQEELGNEQAMNMLERILKYFNTVMLRLIDFADPNMLFEILF